MGTDSTTGTSGCAEPAASCGCPQNNGLVLHRHGICTDPVVKQLGWYFCPHPNPAECANGPLPHAWDQSCGWDREDCW